MKLTVLGSGTSVPHPLRASPAFWLETDAGTVLLDSGPDVAHRMAEEQLDWPHLDAIWVSHFHLDHFGGLAPLLFSMKWAPQTQQRNSPLTLVGPRGLHKLLEAINEANNYRLFSVPFRIVIDEVDADDLFELLPGVTATTMKTPHTKESLALHLKTSGGQSLVYTSDTGYVEELSQFSKDVDLLLMECSFRSNKSLHTHLELSEALSLARQSEARKLVLTHFYPEWDGVDVVSEAKSLWPGNIFEATDGLVISF